MRTSPMGNIITLELSAEVDDNVEEEDLKLHIFTNFVHRTYHADDGFSRTQCVSGRTTLIANWTLGVRRTVVEVETSRPAKRKLGW
jgi:hypothetical protein